MVISFKKLILEKDTVFDESIEVKTSITCKGDKRFSLKVIGNINAGNIDAEDIDAEDIDAEDIDAWDIDAWDINAGNINAGNIDAGNIDAEGIDAWDINAWDINAGNIDARDIICEKRLKKEIENKTIARIFIQDKSQLEKKEWE